MNLDHYASLEASRRLYETGVILKTEFSWISFPNNTFLVRSEDYPVDNSCIPAPSMAEVWRELPECIRIKGGTHRLRVEKQGNRTDAGYGEYGFRMSKINPTDALINLLIWVKKEVKDEQA